jgi:acetylornithine deacetylase/succinyl-diaminopimelate desuccinylase-like protein
MSARINDPAVRIEPLSITRPVAPPSPIDSSMYRALEQAALRVYPGSTVLPGMMNGATDMAQLRARGVQCFGIGAAIDMEDGPKGFGMHSDQERLLESELYRFIRYNYEVVSDLARAR